MNIVDNGNGQDHQYFLAKSTSKATFRHNPSQFLAKSRPDNGNGQDHQCFLAKSTSKAPPTTMTSSPDSSRAEATRHEATI